MPRRPSPPGAGSSLVDTPPESEPYAPWGADPVPSREATISHYIEIVDEGSGLDFLVESDPAFSREPVELSIGQRFAGLVVSGRLGSGGMATVYRARDPEQDTEVALKLLNRGLVKDPRHLQRFRREARLAARLRHQRIVTIHTYGEEEGCAYLTMQLVEGPTLHQVVQAEGPLPAQRAAEIVREIAYAIDAAHRQRVVHRDLKPSNVMIHPVEGPLVLDFGLAKDLGGDPTLTETGEILGTPSFLAPEQAMPAGVPVDHRIDIYGLGALLFYVLSGQHPHTGETAIEVIRHIIDNDPPPLRSLKPEIPAPLEAVCLKAMARDPRDRYQTAGDLAEDLARFTNHQPVVARAPGLVLRTFRTLRKHPLTTSLGLLLVVSLLVGGLVTLSLRSQLALQERSRRGLVLLEQARSQAQRGQFEAADAAFLQAMLLTKNAFLEDPGDEALREALVRIKRERASYAESRGNWALAEELRQNLAQLVQARADEAPATLTLAEARIRVTGLSEGSAVVILAWQGEATERVATASDSSPEVSLAPGQYLALHVDSTGKAQGSYLLVVDAGHHHQLHLGGESLPPPGVFRLPPERVLQRLNDSH